jgi:hypothetical protein
LCLLAAACTYTADESLLEANIVSPTNFRAGSGVIQSVGVLPGTHIPDSGAVAKDSNRNLYRLLVYMDGGRGHQTVDIDSSRFLVGEAVELTNDGRVVKISGTTVNEMINRQR